MASTSKTDYDLIWLHRRKHDKLKVKNYQTFKKIYSAIRELDKNGLVYHLDQVKPKTPHLVFNEGSPNFGMFKLTPNGLLISNYRDISNVWKDYPVDHSILETITKDKIEKYEQPLTEYSGTGYDLFFMQLSMTIDRTAMEDALRYAKERKRLTVFKSHPAAGDVPSTEAWMYFEQRGLTSEYSIFVTDQSVTALIENADRVYSADSAANFNAMLKGKQTATYRPTDMTSIIPLIRTASDLDTLKATPINTIERYLSWYWNKLCIDINKPDHRDKIDYIIKSFEKGLTFEQIFR